MSYSPIYDKLLALAQQHRNELLTLGRWARIDANPDLLYVRLEYGIIHTNGDHEVALGTRHYHINTDTGDVDYWSAVHS